MAFIVSLFKYIILAFCFILLVGIAVLIFAVVFGDGLLSVQTAPYIIGGSIGGLIFLILNLGGIAILISIHDRHREIAEGVHRVADGLEKTANYIQDQQVE